MSGRVAIDAIACVRSLRHTGDLQRTGQLLVHLLGCKVVEIYLRSAYSDILALNGRDVYLDILRSGERWDGDAHLVALHEFACSGILGHLVEGDAATAIDFFHIDARSSCHGRSNEQVIHGLRV